MRIHAWAQEVKDTTDKIKSNKPHKSKKQKEQEEKLSRNVKKTSSYDKETQFVETKKNSPKTTKKTK